MGKVRKPNIFYTLWAAFKYLLFCSWIILNVPFTIINPGGKCGSFQFKIFMAGSAWICGLRYIVRGKLSDKRPLLLIGNHIASYEFAVLPAALGVNFFAKSEVGRMPLIGLFARKLGVQFIDRNPRRAVEMVKKIKEFTEKASYPMVIFPEGTTTNGSYVHPFKSALFNIMEPQINCDENATAFTVQPFVMWFRDAGGNALSDDDLAENYASFDNAKQLHGRSDVRLRGEFEQLFHVMKRGGMRIEIELLPPPSLNGIKNRHEMAEKMFKIVNDRYMELKDKRLIK